MSTTTANKRKWPINFGVEGLDIRSLGLFRFLLGMYLMYELVFYKLGSISVFYLPNALFDLKSHQIAVPNGYSIFDYLLADWQVYVFFAIAFLAYLIYTIGYKARLFAIISYFCLWNIQQRTGMSLGWEGYANVLLFWSIFLPVGRTFNLTHYLGSSKQLKPITSYSYKGLAAYAIILQVGLIYLITFLLKTGTFWQNGQAISAILSDSMIRKTPANFLFSFTDLCTFTNYSLLYFELLFCLMLFFPIFNAYFRAIAAISLFIFHWSSYPFLNLSLYAVVATSASALLLPTFVWNKLSEKIKLPVKNIALKKTGVIKEHLAITVITVCLLLAIIPQNLALLKKESHISHWLQQKNISHWIDKVRIKPIGNNSFLRQRWNFFAPDVPHEIGWITLVGKLEDETLIDLMTNAPPDGAIPQNHFDYPLNYYLMLVRNIFLIPEFYDTNYQKWVRSQAKKWQQQHPQQKLVAIALGLFSVKAEETLKTGQHNASYRSLYVLDL